MISRQTPESVFYRVIIQNSYICFMLKHLAIICLLIGLSTQSKAQLNLVPNPSFEICDSVCNRMFLGHSYELPDTSYYLPFIQNWYSAKFSPDYFHYNTIDSSNAGGCYGQSGCGIPNNVFGYQFPRTDSNYVGLTTYCSVAQNDWAGHNYHMREWLGVRLIDTLKADQCYEFTMYVSRGGKSNRIVSSLGAYFSPDSLFESWPLTPPYYYSPWPMDSNQVQVLHNPWNTIYDTTNWIPVTGIFKAQGGEKYMYLGNMLKDEQYPIVSIDTLESNELCQISYFFIDDVSLYETNEPCKGVGVNEIKKQPTSIYPNPASDIVNIALPHNTKNALLLIYNVQGQLLKQESVTSSQTIDVSGIANGLYLFVIQANGKIIGREKVIIEK